MLKREKSEEGRERKGEKGRPVGVPEDTRLMEVGDTRSLTPAGKPSREGAPITKTKKTKKTSQHV